MKKRTLWSVSEQEKKVDFGALRIRNEVIATIAATSAAEVEGVAKTERNVMERIIGISKGILSRKIYARGAFVEFNQDNELKVTVHVVAEYGRDLSTLASNVQSNVRLAIEKMTGIIPLEVNVIIKSVESGK